MKYKIFNSIFIASFLSLPACAPKRHYTDNNITTRPLASGTSTQTRVSAAVEEWRNSGVKVSAGQNYRISAKGQWRTYPTCNFTGPDGIGLYKAWCDNSPLFPPIIDGYSHSTLIAKIGEQGKPFVVGSDVTFTASEDGPLMFRTNDVLNGNHDNEGYVDVEIAFADSNPAIASPYPAMITLPPGTQQLSASSPTVQPMPSVAIDAIGTITLRRMALVIGNSAYDFSPLKNPVNDAKAMADSLSRLGFEVTLLLDGNQEQMEAAIDKFGRQMSAGKLVGLFYFAGHGVQVDGSNYLIPTDAVIKRQSDVRYKAVNIGQVLGAMEGEDNLQIVILDACRDNPLPRSFRSAGRGLAKIDGPKGTIIGFATSPGSVAADGEDDNGIYTKHLLNTMQVPGLTIEEVFKRVLQGVNQETGGQQIPWMESSFTGNFLFIPE